MASLSRVESKAVIAGGPLSRRITAGGDSLAAFRILADVAYQRSLSMLVEGEIIPRLLMSHASDPPVRGPVGAQGLIDAAEADVLAPLALQVEADTLLDHIDAVLARGASVESVLVDLLAPTARLLGEYWEDDRCDFVDVTMGLWRLQEVVHELATRASADRLLAAGGHRALFASMPGDQHHFGTVVVEELFRRDGWMTERLVDADLPMLLARSGDTWFDMIGLTISCECHTANLASTISGVRNVSRNPRVCIMVGGRILSADPGLALRVGADGTASDARLALKVAADLVRAREGEALARI
jgi:methanogenic corrinoid protein MtbC1